MQTKTSQTKISKTETENTMKRLTQTKTNLQNRFFKKEKLQTVTVLFVGFPLKRQNLFCHQPVGT